MENGIDCPQEVGSFKLSENENKFRIVALGDSVTQCTRWERPFRWPAILEKSIGDCVVVNAGMGGTTSSLGLYRWNRDVLSVKPHCVVINFVLNDSHIRVYECRTSYVVQCTPDRMESNLRVMIEWSRSLGISPVIWTPPPVPVFEGQFRNDIHGETQIEILDSYVGIIEKVCSETSVPLANLWKEFESLVEEFPGPYYNPPDGYHSNDKSQPIIAKCVTELVRPLYSEWKGK